jgi:hypothetical protein
LEDVAAGFGMEGGCGDDMLNLWRWAPQGQLVGKSGQNLAVYEPIMVCPVRRGMRVEKTARSEPFEL